MALRVQVLDLVPFAGEDARHLSCGPDLVEDFERRHRAECERCHVYGAVNMEVRES